VDCQKAHAGITIDRGMESVQEEYTKSKESYFFSKWKETQ